MENITGTEVGECENVVKFGICIYVMSHPIYVYMGRPFPPHHLTWRMCCDILCRQATNAGYWDGRAVASRLMATNAVVSEVMSLYTPSTDDDDEDDDDDRGEMNER